MEADRPLFPDAEEEALRNAGLCYRSNIGFDEPWTPVSKLQNAQADVYLKNVVLAAAQGYFKLKEPPLVGRTLTVDEAPEELEGEPSAYCLTRKFGRWKPTGGLCLTTRSGINIYFPQDVVRLWAINPIDHPRPKVTYKIAAWKTSLADAEIWFRLDSKGRFRHKWFRRKANLGPKHQALPQRIVKLIEDHQDNPPRDPRENLDFAPPTSGDISSSQQPSSSQ